MFELLAFFSCLDVDNLLFTLFHFLSFFSFFVCLVAYFQIQKHVHYICFAFFFQLFARRQFYVYFLFYHFPFILLVCLVAYLQIKKRVCEFVQLTSSFVYTQTSSCLLLQFFVNFYIVYSFLYFQIKRCVCQVWFVTFHFFIHKQFSICFIFHIFNCFVFARLPIFRFQKGVYFCFLFTCLHKRFAV